MKRLLLALVLAPFGFAAVSSAGDDGWIKLFNGKDLSGWTIFLNPKQKADPDKVWSVKDGTIVCQGQPFGYLLTEKEYGDYVLKVQWRWGDKGPAKGARNSGVFVHVVGPDKIWPKAVEAQLMDGHAGDFWLVDGFKLDVDPKRQDPKQARHYFRMIDDVEKPIGEWNQYEITCKGDTIKLVINGKLVNEGKNAELTKGKILLQSEGAEIHFRNVELKPLAKAIDTKKFTESGEGKTRILLIGKDRDHALSTHEYMADCEILAKCLRQTPGVEAIVSNGWPKNPEVLKGVKAIVLHTRMGGNVLFDPLVRDQVEKLLKNGVGLTAIHWSTGADPKNGQLWLDTLGGWFNAEPKVGFSKYGVHTSKLKQAQPEHPICRGWKEYDLREEYYYLLKFRPDIKTVLEADIAKTTYPVAWVYERPDSNGGRSFGHVGGHFHDNFGIPEFRKAIVNGILWTAHLDVPLQGAVVQLNKKDLELPPKEQPKVAVVPPRKGQSETIKLFDGKSLDGWEGYQDLWSVKDGTIIAKNTKPLKYSTYLVTKRNFSDFRLVFQAKLV